MTLFSFSVAVGQACTQAPQETHSELKKVAAARRDLRVEAAPEDGQRERALHFLAGAHAARADDALRGFEGEIGIGGVGRRLQVVGAVIAVAHVAQADDARLRLQFAIAVGAAGQAIERMVGDVELHHAAPQFGEPRRLRVHDHAALGRRGAGGRRALAALDLDEAEPAGAERLETVGRAESRDRRCPAAPPRPSPTCPWAR